MPTIQTDRLTFDEQAAAQLALRQDAARRIMEKGAWREFDEKKRVLERLRQRKYPEFAAYLEANDRPPPAGVAVSGPIAHGSRFLVETAKGNPPPSMSTSFLIDGEVARRTVARVITGGNKMPIGSGFLVGPHLFMTNHHVLPYPDRARQASAQFDHVATSEADVPSQIHAFEPDKFFYSNPALDFTVVRIAEESHLGRVAIDRGWNTLIEGSGKAITNERVNIIQHPGGRKQRVVLRQNRIVNTFRSFIYYETDTWGGSSGSPVLNDEWNLVALHKGTIGETNYGIRISEIARDLRDAESSNRILGSEPKLEGCFDLVPVGVLRKARSMVYFWQEMMDAGEVQTPPAPPGGGGALTGFARDAAAWDALDRMR